MNSLPEKQSKEKTAAVTRRSKTEKQKLEIAGLYLKFFQKHSRSLYFLLVVLLCLIFIFSIYLLLTAKNRGETIGTAAGSIAGIATGSADGWTNGLSEGKQEGLEAKDTSVVVKERLSKKGTLEVLKADVVFSNNFKVGTKYNSLSLCKGKVLFKLDLSKALIETPAENELKILLPPIECDFIGKYEDEETLMVYQSLLFNGSTLDGLQAAQNNYSQIEANAKNMTNYSELKEVAESSARKQIESIAKAACIIPKNISVVFEEGE